MTRFEFVFVFLCIFAICNGQICSGHGAGPVVCCSGYVWVDSSKSCEPCAVGFFGPKCALSCGYPSYGEDCQSTCHCSKELCHHVLGCFNNQHEVTISRLCSGPSGLDCCTGYFWNSSLITCEPCNIGYHGPNCKEQCIYPSYGKDCQLKCNCLKESCSHVYGCHKSKVCDTGFTGPNCTAPCVYPSYGKDCHLKCSCSNNICHHVYGCVKNRHTNTTTLEEVTALEEEGKKDSYMVLSIICLASVSGVLLILYIMSHAIPVTKIKSACSPIAI
ncbi:uncharacterized protein LOC111105254 isoform X2 [Crassostrea virginica]